MTDKQIKEEIKQVVTNLGNIEFTVEDELKFCKEVLKRKEQECEELKKIINEAKNSNLDLKSFLVGEAVQNEYEQQLDQLKRENDLFRTCHDNEQEKRRKYKQTLAEIKEIAEDFYLDGEHVKDKYLAQEIIQKISKCEVENGRNNFN